MAKKRAASKARRIGRSPSKAQPIGKHGAGSSSRVDGPVITSVVARAVTPPLARPLYVATGAVESAALVLIDIKTNAGVTGRSYVFGFTPHVQAALVALIDGMGQMIVGDILSPYEIERKLRAKHMLVGLHNVVLFAISGIDMAVWDTHAQCQDLPLVTALGGTPGAIPAYNSNGLGIMPVGKLANEAEQLLSEGFDALKMRVGRESAGQDLAAVRAVKKAVGPDVILMCDFNQGLTVSEALLRGKMLDDEGGLTWIEEPTRAEDYRGNAQISAALRTPVSIGENFMGPEQMADALAHDCCDFVMPDVQRISGVSGWLRAATLAEVAGVEMSSHLFPEYSCHLLGVTPTRHWLEYVDWAQPLLQEKHSVHDGVLQIPDRPGSGLVWDEKAVTRYLC